MHPMRVRFAACKSPILNILIGWTYLPVALDMIEGAVFDSILKQVVLRGRYINYPIGRALSSWLRMFKDSGVRRLVALA